MSAKLVIKIVDKGTDYTNQYNQETHPSLTGHMWWELYDDQKKTLQDLGKTFEEYVTFIEDYYSVKTTTSDSFSDLLTKYNLNTNLDNYSNIAPSFIVNDGNGNDFNLSAFPNFSDLFENNSEYQINSLGNFLDSSLTSSLVSLF